jgi:hypothetical protein
MDVVNTVAQPVEGLAKDINNGPIKQVKQLGSEIVHSPGALVSQVIHGSPQANQSNNQYNQNLKSGKITPIVDKTIKSIPTASDQTNVKNTVNQLVAKGAFQSQINAHVKQQQQQIQKTQDTNVNRVGSEVAGTLSLASGGSAAKDAVESAISDTAKTPIVSKVVGAVKNAVTGSTAKSAAAYNAATTVQDNPSNPNPKAVANAAGAGYLFGVGGELAGKVAGKVAGEVINKIKGDTPVEPTATTAPVNKLKGGRDSITGMPLDRNQVEKYKADIAAGKPIEPLVTNNVSGQTFVQDGAHRLQAAKEMGLNEVPIANKDLPIQTKSLIDQAPTVPEGNKTQAILNRNFVAQKYQDFHAPLAAVSKDMSARDAKLLEGIESPGETAISPKAAAARVERIAQTADNPQQFRNTVKAWQDFTKTHLATARSIPGQEDLGERQNYLPHESTLVDKNGKPVEAGKNPEMKQYAIKNGKPKYAYQRVFNNLAQRDAWVGPNGEHYVRTNPSILDDMHSAIDRASNQHGSAALAKGLAEAHPGQVIHAGIDAKGNSLGNLKIAGGRGISLTDGLEEGYNKHAPAEESQGVTKAYDAANRGLKYAKLGGGFFHSLTTAGSAAGQQIMNPRTYAHPIETLANNLKTIAATGSKKVNDAVLADHARTGVLDFSRKTGVTLSPKEILGDANLNTLDKAKNSSLNPIRAVHDLVFKRQIPNVKLMITKQKLESKFPGMDFHNPTPEQLAYGRSIAKGVNNLGGINRLVDGLPPKTAQKLSRVVLATDFTEGKIRTLGNALNLTKQGPEARLARQLVIGKSLVFAMPGMIALASSGKLNLKDPHAVGSAFLQQILSPGVPLSSRGAPSKSSPNGTPQIAELPATYISEFGKLIAPAITGLGANAKESGVKTAVSDYATARLAAVPSLVNQGVANKDFYGNPIYGNDKQGNPQSGKKVAANIAGEVAPIPLVQTGKTLSGAQNTATAIGNIAGLKIKNNPNSPEGQQTAVVSRLYNTFNPQLKQSSLIKKQVQALVANGQYNKAGRVAHEWNLKVDAVPKNYPDNFGQHSKYAWDQKWTSLKIPLSGNSLQTRINNARIDNALNNPTQ